MFNYVGKRDRRDEEFVYRRKLTPKTELEKVIHALCHVKESEKYIPIDTEIAMQSYVRLRDYRHDIWCDYLSYNRVNQEHKFNNTNVGDFIDFLYTKYNILIPAMTAEYMIKSPDILIYDRSSGVVFIGDVSVSISRKSAEKRKYEKYYQIFDHFERFGLRVRWANCIINVDMSNANSVIKTFDILKLVNYNKTDLARTKFYHEMCNTAMERFEKECYDPKLFIEKLNRHDEGLDPMHRDVTKPMLNIDYKTPEKYEPIRSEDEIIDMIRVECDRQEREYFDYGYDKAREKFTELYQKFSENNHKSAKSTLKAVYNTRDVEESNGHKLIKEVVENCIKSNNEVISQHMINILPTITQLNKMENFNEEDKEGNKINGVHGPWQYTMKTVYSGNILTLDMREKLSRGKKNPNQKTEPKSIPPEDYQKNIDMMESIINDLGSQSRKRPFLDETWDAANIAEYENTDREKMIYDYTKTTNAAQLGQSLSMFYQRLTHIKASLSTKDNIFVPPNSSFIIIVPKEHQPFNENRSDVPMIFITRFLNGEVEQPNEYEHTFDTTTHKYYISKLCRIPINKLAQWDQAGHRIVACSSFLLNQCPALQPHKEKVIGTISLIMLDLHQKTSELLDLLKYVSFMPFAELSRISKLIEDKFDIQLKTGLDVWAIKKIESFMNALASDGRVIGRKERTKVFNGNVLDSCLGMEIKVPSFIDNSVTHDSIQNFIEEISMVNIIRGKQFYGSQFMDKSITLTAMWNNEYIEECLRYPGWGTGHGDGPFPFDSKFCYSDDAIYYAQIYTQDKHPINPNKVASTLSDIKYDDFMHNNCSLRGCTKEKEQRRNVIDLHTTSLDACLDYYKSINYDTVNATVIKVGLLGLIDKYIMQYTMSEKEQRGGGRPIATPTLKAKAVNMMIEKPEQAIGTYTDNNILVAGKHKLATQSKTYKSLLEEGYRLGKKNVYQCTEDQSKFSENDNTRKYKTYISNNIYLPPDVRYLQIRAVEKMVNREHLIKRMPRTILEDPNLSKYINDDKNGIKAVIGWPQGMLNNISTSIHSIADYWITYAFNKAYGYDVVTKGLVHSDDSWFAIACNSLDEFRKFCVFRALAKRLFCLTINDKKLWASKMLGELISNFNINGEVYVPVSKVVANSFTNLLYQNWVIDTHNQVSNIQQLYRQGCNIGSLIMINTIQRQQLIAAYNISSEMKSRLYLLPVEMGGYPKCSVFELGVTGVNCHYKKIYDHVNTKQNDEVSKLVLRTLELSMVYNITKEEHSIQNLLENNSKTNIKSSFYQDVGTDIDYTSVIIPKRGEVFGAIKHIMPKSRKVAKTIEKLKSLPFETDGLEMLVTRPKSLKLALGHLKSQTSTLLYNLAAEKYTSNKRRLAINQSIQATGKTVRLAGLIPMKINDMLETILRMDNIKGGSISQLQNAFEDDTNIVNICHSIVNNSTLSLLITDKRKCVNKMPSFEDKFTTMCPLRTILLNIIDKKEGSELVKEHTTKAEPPDVLDSDTKLVEKRFSSYFAYYTPKVAANLIMQQYFTRISPRLWIQPKLRNDDIQNFLCDLYGKTLSSKSNFNVKVEYRGAGNECIEAKIVQSLYSVSVLDRMYGGFPILSINDKPLTDTLKDLDYSTLSQSDFLKYSILTKLYLNTNEYLKEYEMKKQYSQHYIKPQRCLGGSYYGKFKVAVRYCNMIATFEGVPEDMLITVNDGNLIPELIMAMYLYVKNDHKTYAYSNPMNWHLNKFWSSIASTNMVLVNLSGTVNTIKRFEKVNKGVSIVVNANLKYPIRDAGSTDIDYEFDNTLRLVFRVTEDSKVRVDNVKQNMSCPMSSRIQLEHRLIQGFDNNMLISSRVMLDITMQRSFNAPTTVLRRLLSSRKPQLKSKDVMITYINLLKSIRNDLGKCIEVEPEVNNVEYTIEDITTPMEFINKNMDTEPEVLDAVEQDYIYDDTDRLGSLVKHSNLTLFLTRCLYKPLSKYEKHSMMAYILEHRSFKRCSLSLIKQIKEQELTDTDLIDTSESINIDFDLIYFVHSNGLSSTEWDITLLKSICKAKNSISESLKIICRKFIRFVENIEELSDEESISLINI